MGCDDRNSHWSPTGVRAVHTASGPGGRRRKGLEPSRRLSETTGPRSPSAFRVVFPTTEVTKCGARCKRPAAFFTHRAPDPVRGSVRYLGAQVFSHMFRRSVGRRTHVPVAQGRAVQALVFKAKALHSHVIASAGASNAHVTAASALRVRWAGGATANGGVDGAAGSRAKHAAGRGDGRACTGAGGRVATTADGRADAGARRSRRRRHERCNGGERGDGRCEHGAKRRREHRPTRGGQ